MTFKDDAYLAGNRAGNKDVTETVERIPIDKIMPGPWQPRRTFDKRAMQDLVDSIREKGVLEPIIVCRSAAASDPCPFLIVMGERRWRASKNAEQQTIPCIVRDYSNKDALIVALVENEQREDLTFYERMTGYARLRDELGSADEVAQKTGKARRTVDRYLEIHRKISDVPEMMEIVMKQSATVSLDATKVLADSVSAIKKLQKANRREFDRVLRKLEKNGINKCSGWLQSKFLAANGDSSGTKERGYYQETDKDISLIIRVRKGQISDELRQELETACSVFLGKIARESAAEPSEA